MSLTGYIPLITTAATDLGNQRDTSIPSSPLRTPVSHSFAYPTLDLFSWKRDFFTIDAFPRQRFGFVAKAFGYASTVI